MENLLQILNFYLIQKKNSSRKYISTIFGPTCDGGDIVMKGYKMPELNIGDYIIWENMGAYTIVSSCDFNGINQTKPMAIYIDNTDINYRISII